MPPTQRHRASQQQGDGARIMRAVESALEGAQGIELDLRALRMKQSCRSCDGPAPPSMLRAAGAAVSSEDAPDVGDVCFAALLAHPRLQPRNPSRLATEFVKPFLLDAGRIEVENLRAGRTPFRGDVVLHLVQQGEAHVLAAPVLIPLA